MNTLWFWKKWSKNDQNLFWLLSILGLSAFIVFVYTYLQNPSLAFNWEQFQQIELIETPIRSFSVGLSSIDLPADNLVLFETFSGSSLQSTPWLYYALLLGVTVGFLFFVTFISTLKRFSFLGAIGFLILMLVSFHWESLLVLGISHKAISGVVIALYAGTAYYFQSFRTHHSFITRLITFTAITFIIGLAVFFLSAVPQPFLILSGNTLLVATAMSIVFAIMVSHEIVAFFVAVITSSRTPTKSAMHFFLISAIYFVNLTITFLIREKYIFWDIITVNSFFLLAVSAVLGIWGVRHRESLYADAVENPIHAVFLYLSFLLTAFTTIGFSIGTDNSPLIETLSEVILFVHMGYGIIFLAYVTANFGPMLMANVHVYRILYKPSAMPFFTFRAMGTIATFAFLSFSSPLLSYFDRAIAAVYNAQGDIQFNQSELTTAEAYYRKSLAYRNRNHHAHYALATLYATQLEPIKEMKEYEGLLSTTPSEATFLNLNDIYSTNGNYSKNQEVLKEGLSIFNGSGLLANAQGLNYYQIGLLDSSLYYFQKSRKSSFTKITAETNIFATSVKLNLKFPADSLLQLIGSHDAGVQSNAIALANAQRLPLQVNFEIPKDTVLNLKIATLLCNQLTNQANTIDTLQLRKIATLARKPINANFKEYLLSSVAQAYYQQDQIKKAIDIIREMAYSTDQGKRYNLLAIYFLEQGDALTAARYFKIAHDKKVPGAQLREAIAYSETDSIREALPLWRSLISSTDSLERQQAKVYLKILERPVTSWEELTDVEKNGLCHYRVSLADSVLFQKIANSINDNDLRARAIYERSKKWYRLDEVQLAINELQLLRGAQLKSKSLADEILVLNLFLSTVTQQWDFIESKLKEGLPSEFKNESTYLATLLALHTGKGNEVQSSIAYLAEANLLFEEGLILAANYYTKDTTDRLKPYSILVNGLLANPNSVRLLKEHSKLSAALGFDEEAQQSLTKLKQLMSTKRFEEFVNTNSTLFSKTSASDAY
ncbi:MAG: hypothetical protein HYZ44_00985 [Bacteroidetes bacterium]|nr:hypothetical protein [Bacteroidota bacterium]